MFWSRKLTEQDIFSALQGIYDPRSRLDIVSLRWIGGVVIQKNHVLVTLEVDADRAGELEPLRHQAEQTLRMLKGVSSARVILTAQKSPGTVMPVVEPQAEKPKPESRPLAPHVKNIIAVASGKGGVGKSTVAANLAVALSQQGLKVGLLDADIYGPSVPMLMGVRHKKPEQQQDYLMPLEAHGVKVMSMGFLVDEEAPMVWRGPMVQSALQQMLRDVAWGELDVLLLDMPPGTGDAQLTIAQKVPLKGAVIVSTPQDIALLDTIKGVHMFQKVSVPILGILENMSLFCCPNCNHVTPIFGVEGAQKRAMEMNVPFLGALPLDPAIRSASDEGNPVALQRDTVPSQIFRDVAQRVWSSLGSATAKHAPRIIQE